jgi:hypothetical protein
MCAPTNIYLDYTRNTCVGEVATATTAQPRSYFAMHLDTSLSYILFSLFTFQFLTSSFLLRFPSFKYYAFYLFYLFYFVLFIPPLQKSNHFKHHNSFFICVRVSLNVNGYLMDVFTTDCTQESKLNSTEAFSAWMTFLKRA